MFCKIFALSYGLENPLDFARPWVDGIISDDCDPPDDCVGFIQLSLTPSSGFLSRANGRPIEEALVATDDWDGAALRVRDAANFTFHQYGRKAWGHDGIHPDSGDPSDWCNLSILVLDSLGTLKLTGLDQEFARGRSLVRKMLLTKVAHGMHSLFEINIRALAGLLAAHALTDDDVFKDAALRLGNNLVGALITESYLPNKLVDPGTGESRMDPTSLADAGTLSMEFWTLSHISGNASFAQAASNTQKAIMDAAEAHGYRGLVPTTIHADGASISFLSRAMSMGGGGDSYFEYLLKGWLMTGRTNDRLKDAWKLAMAEMMDHMVTRTKSGLTFIADVDATGVKMLRMQHLTCFVPGLLVLGAETLPTQEVNPSWVPLAREVARTCNEMYARTPSGLAPEFVTFDIDTSDPEKEMHVGSAAYNMLRPETLESNYLLWYFTGDESYRQSNLRIFEAFEEHSKAAWGYSSVYDVTEENPHHSNEEESFWVAETLKYLYLSFSPKSTLNLSKYVLNTEAQPLKIWTA